MELELGLAGLARVGLGWVAYCVIGLGLVRLDWVKLH